MKWFRRVLDRLRGKPETLHRADLLTEALEKGDIKVTIVARNARALAELRRLDSYARR